MNLTIHIHVMSRLSDGKSVPLLLLYNFMAWTGANLTFYLSNVGSEGVDSVLLAQGRGNERGAKKCTKFLTD